MRLLVPSSPIWSISGLRVRPHRRSVLATAILRSSKGQLEIRTGSKVAGRIAEFLAMCLDWPWPLSQDPIVPFGSSVEQLAERLGGSLLQTTSIADTVLTELDQPEQEALAEIVLAVDEFLQTGDIERAQERLEGARQSLAGAAEHVLQIPLAALVLAGMNSLSLSSRRDDLRRLPLFQLLQPHLQHQGGYIRFPVGQDSVVRHTIRLGLDTNTVYFVTLADEQAIAVVREQISPIGGH